MMHSPALKTTLDRKWAFDALGTKWEIVSARAITNETKKSILAKIEQFDKTYSRFREDSLVRKAADEASEYTLPSSAEDIFTFYDVLWELTSHRVTPVIGGTLASAGYDAEYSLKPKETLSPVPDYKKVVKRNGSTLTFLEKVQLDIGAVGKGYMVDEISKLLQDDGHASFVVDGSGDLRVVGEHAEVIGLENPRANDEVIGTVEIENRALCASASNRRAWGEWHHIIDPTTLRPVNDIVATWVIADSAMIADGLSTALFFTTPKKLAERYTYEYIRMHSDGSVEYSNYFAKGIF